MRTAFQMHAGVPHQCLRILYPRGASWQNQDHTAGDVGPLERAVRALPKAVRFDCISWRNYTASSKLTGSCTSPFASVVRQLAKPLPRSHLSKKHATHYALGDESRNRRQGCPSRSDDLHADPWRPAMTESGGRHLAAKSTFAWNRPLNSIPKMMPPQPLRHSSLELPRRRAYPSPTPARTHVSLRIFRRRPCLRVPVACT